MNRANLTKNFALVLVILVISIVIISGLLPTSLQQSNLEKVNELTISKTSKTSPPPTILVEANQTNKIETTDPISNCSSTIVKTGSVTLNDSESLEDKMSELTQFAVSLPIENIQSQTVAQIAAAETNQTDKLNSNNIANNSSTPPSIDPDYTGMLKFEAYTYGGYIVQRLDPNQFLFPYPDSTNHGQLSGSDILTLNYYSVQTLEFDAIFNTPQISALGFDEMAIFAASSTITYKGTEFGIRMDLKDGFIYGYTQEPNSYYGYVVFQMVKLASNDGLMHHYTLTAVGSEVTFRIDGIDCGHLRFPSNADSSLLKFAICAVVHRFTDDWDSEGNSMYLEKLRTSPQ